jgi:predicted transposase/invertase (TIGR01784 family)
MKRYLDPKNDLVFKRIFGEHAQILRAFLNAILPLEADERIQSLEYLPTEQVPEIPLLKHTLVDVRCRDVAGRQFIVEMQMQWTNAFLQRVLFNASKACVRQLERGERYELLQPVFGVSLLDDIFDRDSEEFFHHYAVVNVEKPARRIEGLALIFIELPKFHPTIGKAERDLWLRFLRETGMNQKAPEELAEGGTELQEALRLAEQAAYTEDDLVKYDRYWDAVSTEKTIVAGRYAEGLENGQKLGLEKGEKLGLEKGEKLGLEKGEKLGLEKGEKLGLEKALKRLMARGMTESEARGVLGF